jgi:hypothetical protein
LAKIFARLIENLLLARRFVKEQSRGTTHVSVILIGRVGQTMAACITMPFPRKIIEKLKIVAAGE